MLVEYPTLESCENNLLPIHVVSSDGQYRHTGFNGIYGLRAATTNDQEIASIYATLMQLAADGENTDNLCLRDLNVPNNTPSMYFANGGMLGALITAYHAMNALNL